MLEPEVRRTLGIELAELRRSDLPRFFRAPEEDGQFPADLLVPSFMETMLGLGIDVADQAAVHLDLDSRPNKTPRAFCAPVARARRGAPRAHARSAAATTSTC